VLFAVIDAGHKPLHKPRYISRDKSSSPIIFRFAECERRAEILFLSSRWSIYTTARDRAIYRRQ